MNLKEREKLFDQFINGQPAALSDLLAVEKDSLFDYLVRMTGGITIAADTIDDVYMGLADGGNYDFRNYKAFRVCLYSTARKFNGDKWNADTAMLENRMFTEQAEELQLGPKDREAFRAIDASLRALSGPEREAVILRERSGFDEGQIAEIMECSVAEAESRYIKGMQKVDADCSGIVQNPEAAVRNMPGHPAPAQTGAVTMDLSMVMAGIKQRPAGLRSPTRIAFFLIVLALIIGTVFFPDSFIMVKLWQLVADIGSWFASLRDKI